MARKGKAAFPDLAGPKAVHHSVYLCKAMQYLCKAMLYLCIPVQGYAHLCRAVQYSHKEKQPSLEL